MTAPLVSILIPCYNAEKYIGETLESVFRQSWPEFEVIVVDDESIDSSVSEVEKFGTSRIKLIRQANAGAGAARNRAYQASSGEFIQFLDADDLIAPDKIDRQMRRLVAYPGCVASAEWGRFRSSPNEVRFAAEVVWRDLDPLNWLILSRIDGLGMLFPALWLIPKTIVDAAGPWDTTLSLADDGEYFTRLLLCAERVLFCEGARCYYRSAVPYSLSSRKSAEARSSQFRVTELCEAYVRAREDSERVRRCFALSWQHLAHACYPANRILTQRALERARLLHEVTIGPDGGPVFRSIAFLFGWRFARILQVISGRS